MKPTAPATLPAQPSGWDFDDTDRRASLQAVYAHLTGMLSQYHGLVVNLNVIFMTVSVLLLSPLIPLARTLTGLPHLLLAAIPLVLAALPVHVTRLMRRRFRDIAAVVLAMDELMRMFEPGAYLKDRALYPAEWRRFGSGQWREIDFEVFVPAQLLVGTIAAAVLALSR